MREVGGPVPSRRRSVSRRSVLLATGLLAAGCGWPGSARRSGDPSGVGPVTLVTGRDTTGYLRGLLDGWNAAHPEERATLVELPEVADEVRAQLVSGLGERTDRFDVLNIDMVWTAEFAAKGWIAPLDGAEFPLDRFLPPVLESGRWNGKLYAVPYVTNAGLLYYRKDLLDRAGLQPPTSWAELARQAATVGAGNGIGGYAGQLLPYEGLTVNVAEAVRSAGGRLLDEQGRVAVDSAQAREGLDFLAGGVRDGWIPRVALSYQEEESRRAFEDGKLVFLRNWPYVYPLASAADSAVAGRFGVVPLPGAAGPGGGILGGSNLAVSGFSRHQRSARALIAYLTSEDVQRRVLTEGELPPVWASLYGEPELVRRFPYLPVLRQSILTAGSRPGVPEYQQLSLAVSEASYQALLGRWSAQEAVHRLAADLADIVR